MTNVSRARLNLPSPYKKPSTEIETALCACFSGALDLDVVGLDDDFFDLGGDSLAAERLALLAAEKNLPSFPAIKLFSLGTPGRLAAWLETALQGAQPNA